MLVRQVIAEAKQGSDACPHAPSPLPPTTVFGCDLDEAEAIAIASTEGQTDSRGNGSQQPAVLRSRTAVPSHFRPSKDHADYGCPIRSHRCVCTRCAETGAMAGLPEKNRLEALALNDVISALTAFMLTVIKAANASKIFFQFTGRPTVHGRMRTRVDFNVKNRLAAATSAPAARSNDVQSLPGLPVDRLRQAMPDQTASAPNQQTCHRPTLSSGARPGDVAG